MTPPSDSANFAKISNFFLFDFAECASNTAGSKLMTSPVRSLEYSP